MNANPYSLAGGLAGVYRQDPLMQRLVAGFDDGLLPFISAVQSLPAYLDPQTTPDGLIDWLARWVAVEIGESLSNERRRRMLSSAAEVNEWRGTLRGVRAVVRAYCGAEAEVEDSGAVTWTRNAAARPNGANPTVTIRIPPDCDPVDADELTRIVKDVIPAHVRAVILT